MYQGQKRYILLDADGVDLEGKAVYATFRNVAGKKFEKTGKDLDISGSTVAVMFTQEESLSIPVGPVQVELRWIDEAGNTGNTEMGYMDVRGIMKREPIVYREVEE